MEQVPIVSQEDIARVNAHMMINHCGYRSASMRYQITQTLHMEDRHFRQVCSQIPEIITSHLYGYYILPLVDLTGEETRIAREIINGEDRRRMISLYLRQRRQKQAIRKMSDKERQLAFV